MRRLDWFLAGVVAAFLAAALIVEAHALPSFESLALHRPLPIGVGEVTVRRLVSQWPRAALLPGEAR